MQFVMSVDLYLYCDADSEIWITFCQTNRLIGFQFENPLICLIKFANIYFPIGQKYIL